MAATAFIICGALGREILDIIQKHNWEVDVVGLPALDHLVPDRIAPHVEKRILALRQQYQHLIVVYGDCGSKGALDQVLAQQGVERIEGPHCYEMYAGEAFHDLMEEQPGTFFLTDFLVRGFYGTVVKGMGLDRYPKLKGEYFRNYKRVIYLIQKETPELLQKAQAIAEYLELPLELHQTGYGSLEERLVAWMENQ